MARFCPACDTPVSDGESLCPRCNFDLDARPEPFKPGTVLEQRYRIDAEAGRGGMGVVYRGTDLTLRRAVAIKALLQSEADGRLIARFMREARALARVEHPGLVSVYAAGREGQAFYMVMRFVEGQTLTDYLAEHGRLEPEAVGDLIRQVCDAVAALHRQGLVHRDLKPGNLMRQPDGRYIVMDLGIVNEVDAETDTTSKLLGTPRYMAPEALNSVPLDGRADLYALGVIAYEALAGEPPFDGPTPMAVLYKQAHTQPPPLAKKAPDTPSVMVRAVDKALAKRPEDRFPDASAMAAAVAIERAAPRARRLRALLGALAAAIAAAAITHWLGSRPIPTYTGAEDSASVAIVAVPDAGRLAVAAPPVPDAGAIDAGAHDARIPDSTVPDSTVPDSTVPDSTVLSAAPSKARPKVTIRLESDPPRAMAYEGRRRLGRTPVTLTRRAADRKISIRLRRDGYDEQRIQLDLSESRTVRTTLQPIFELIP